MTNSSPPNPSEPPSDNSSKKSNQSGIFQKNIMDEWIAVLLTFGVIGTVIFASVGNKSLDWKNPFSSGSRGLFSRLQDRENEEYSNLAPDEDLEIIEEPSSSTFSDTAKIAAVSDASKELKTDKARDSRKPSLDRKDQKEEKRHTRLNTLLTPVIPTVTVPESTTSTTQPKPPEAIPKPPVVSKTDPQPPEAAPKPPVVSKTDPQPPEAIPKPPVVGKTDPKESKLAFNDVPKEHWAYPFIQTLGEKNFIIPNSGKNFEPDQLITRAGMADLVSHAFQYIPQNLAAKNFNDVSSGSKKFDDINKAVKLGFMKGYSDQKFHPELQIPRYQVLVTLATGLGLKPEGNTDNILSKFTDRDQIPDWATEKVAAAVQSDLAINRPGIDFTSLEPDKSATRAEVAAMIYQALVKEGKLESIESTYIVPYP